MAVLPPRLRLMTRLECAKSFAAGFAAPPGFALASHGQRSALGMVEIRNADPGDLAGILAIYNEVIATSTAVYLDAPATLEDRRAWFEGRQAGGFPVLVGVDALGVAGFSSFGDFRGAYSGYRHSVEHSVHIRSDLRGHGLGRRLVEALFPHARAMRMHVMIGAVDAANVGSIRFHEKLGFTHAGLFREVGRKFDRWLDLVFLQRILET